MREHDARLLPGALASLVSCAIAGATRQWDTVATIWMVAAVVSGIATGALFARARGIGVRGLGSPLSRSLGERRAADVALAVALACALTAAVTGVAAARWHRDVPEWARAPSGDDVVLIEGTVTSDPRSAGRDAYTGEQRWSVTVEAEWACTSPCGEASRVRMSVDVVVDDGEPPGLGEVIAVEGKAAPSRDTRKVVTLWGAQVTLVDQPRAVLAVVASVRASARGAAAGLPDAVRGLTLGMTIGDTEQVPTSLEADMRTTGLTHLTAVSGSHFAIVTAVAGWMLRRAVRSRVVRGVLLAGGMSALAALVLPEPSVLRALTMALTVALGWWWGRRAKAIPALAAGIVVLLLAQPGLAGAIGLQLSVLAVIAIVTWSPRLAVVLGRWMLAPLARAISVPLAAWLACWPLLIALRPGMGPYAVFANLVAALAALPVTVIGLVATLLSALWPAGGAALMQLAGACAWPVVWAAKAFAAAPGAWVPWPGGIGGIALAVAVTGSIVLATATDRFKVAFRLAAAIVAIVLVGAGPLWTVTIRPAMEDWKVVVCDVGQGDMMLVRVDEHAAVVVDTGPPGGAGAACLERYHVTRVPLLVLTHPHADHDGAVGEIAAVASIEAAWVSPAATSQGHDIGARQAEQEGIPVSVPAQGQSWVEADVSLAVLYPPPAAAGASSSSEINDASITLSISAGAVAVLALGDLEVSGQDAVARVLGGPVVVDLVKVAHHGSAAQSRTLADLVTARVASISVGEGNAYGHPSPEALEIYGQRALVVLTTEQCGDIAVGRDASVASGCPESVAG